METRSPTWQRSCDHLLYGPGAEFMAKGRDWATTEMIRRKLVDLDDLLTDARQCAMELEEVAKILRPTHPSLAGVYDAAADRPRALVAKASGGQS